MASPFQKSDQIPPSERPPIDVAFKVIPPEAPSTSRALVVRGAAQPADSRTEQALKQLAAAKARAGRSPAGQAIGQEIIAALNGHYVADPDGLETLAALQRADFARAEAVRIERERAKAARAIAVRSREPTTAEMFGALAMGAIGLWSRQQDAVRQRKWDEWNAAQNRKCTWSKKTHNAPPAAAKSADGGEGGGDAARAQRIISFRGDDLVAIIYALTPSEAPSTAPSLLI